MQVRVNIEDLKKKAGELRARLRPGILHGLADWLFRITRQSFDRQASPEGSAWPALSARYAAWKAKRKPGKGMLQLSGALLRTLIRGVEGNAAFVGSNLPYAGAHQYGFRGTVAVGAHRRGRRIKGRGKVAGQIALVTAHTRSMHLPARPFLPSPEFAEREGRRIVEELAQDEIAAAGAA